MDDESAKAKHGVGLVRTVIAGSIWSVVAEFVDAARKGGRPYLDPDGQPSLHWALRVPRALGERVDALAARTGRRRSDLLRDALEAYLSNHAA